ncbi:MAG: type II toxin-antitoxin system HicA family toxin [Dehalococcoidia bacterium]
MTQLDKLISRVRARPAEANYTDVHRLLDGFGWTLANERGSHLTYRKQGERPLVVIKSGGRKVKRIYLDRICDRLGLDELP